MELAAVGEGRSTALMRIGEQNEWALARIVMEFLGEAPGAGWGRAGSMGTTWKSSLPGL